MNNINQIIKYMVVCCGIAFWLVMSTAGTANAQNFAGIISSEPNVEESDQIVETEDTFSDISLVYSDPTSLVDEVNQNEIPDYILESSLYTLGVEDVIEITVLRHPEVSGEYIINAEGKIQYDFIGDIKVEGLKKDEVKDILVQRLSEYIITPNVTVQITGYNSKVVYVIGEVGAPGKIIMRGDTITVREALIQAGLPLLTAKGTQTKLITPSDTGKIETKGVNIDKLLYKGDLRENLVMKPGDTLYVPPTFMAKALRVMQPVAAPINSASSTGRRVYTGGF